MFRFICHLSPYRYNNLIYSRLKWWQKGDRRFPLSPFLDAIHIVGSTRISQVSQLRLLLYNNIGKEWDTCSIVNITVVPYLMRQPFHSYGHECSTVMEQPSQQLWNGRLNCVPCGLITKDVFVEKIVFVIAILSEHCGNAFLLFLIFHRLKSLFPWK